MPGNNQTPSYEAITDGVAVRVQPRFMHDESKPATGEYVWAYTVEIENGSDKTWQLMRRYWKIIDAEGRAQEVEGEGVVGQQPFIPGNDEYTYSSGTALETPVGVMQGHYMLLDEKGQKFITEIDPFRLAVPNVLN